ncbi:acyl-CoA dehydrogenase family protein, partial [Streptomyces sp. DT225]
VPLSALWVPTASAGIFTDTTTPLGLRGWSMGHLHFNHVRVGKDLLLGAPGDGRWIFDTHFSNWRLMMALVCLGAATAAIEETMARACRRSVGDDVDVAACSAAKALATDTAYRAVDLALQLHGSEGYTSCTPMEKRLRDIRGLRIADGPNDTLYSVLAQSMLAESRPAVPLVAQRQA